MKIILFYDLPTITKQNRSDFAKFRTNLEKNGFIMLQESVYIKHAYNYDWVNRTKIKLQKILPPSGDIRVLTITNKQYEAIDIMKGNKSLQESVLDDRELVII